MSLKDDYVEKLKTQLDEWSVEIDVLDERLHQVDADLRIKYAEQVDNLRFKRDEAKLKLLELQASAGDAWQELRKGSDDAWEVIKHAVSEARKKF